MLRAIVLIFSFDTSLNTWNVPNYVPQNQQWYGNDNEKWKKSFSSGCDDKPHTLLWHWEHTVATLSFLESENALNDPPGFPFFIINS